MTPALIVVLVALALWASEEQPQHLSGGAVRDEFERQERERADKRGTHYTRGGPRG